ncbi:unnamed protein product [Eruca vesicaria subsp. sativa]|uniref:Uncharacterized protein n=1 Tax=Eruca vesicaria subsp. sativa TaxID=29727 RepID=A0ABC8J4M3_ERUVS|nr:unnamed protein product [Eruca vesicaria subsp. sativa]
MFSAYRGIGGEAQLPNDLLAADLGSGEQETASNDAGRYPMAERSSSSGLRLKLLGLLPLLGSVEGTPGHDGWKWRFMEVLVT